MVNGELKIVCRVGNVVVHRDGRANGGQEKDLAHPTKNSLDSISKVKTLDSIAKSEGLDSKISELLD